MKTGLHRVFRACLAVALPLYLVGCDRSEPLAPEIQAAATAGPGPAVNAPSNTHVVAVSESRIDVFWQDNATNETGFEIHRSATGPGGTFTLVATLGANWDNYGDIGLSPSTDYCYRIRAFKGRTKYSVFSNTACGVTLAPPPPAPPNPPFGAFAKPTSSTTVDVSWADTSSNEDGFRVERSTDGGTSFVAAGTTGPNIKSFSDGGRASEQTVCYRVIAFNGVGGSPPSNSVCTTPPRAPTDVTAAKVAPLGVLVGWTDNSGVEESYELQRSTAETGPFATIATGLFPNWGYGTVSYRDSVSSGTTVYWYRARAIARYTGGYSDFSNTASASVDVIPPNAPSATSATAFAGTNEVIWADNSTNEQGFRVERSTDGGTTWVTAGTTGVNGGSLYEAWLVEEQQVCYRVLAFNSTGDSPPSSTACTVLPAAPGALTATTVDHQAIDLAWADNSNFEDGYEVYRTDPSDYGCCVFYLVVTLPADAVGFRDTGLASGLEYAYFVRAIKGVMGRSFDSSQASATTAQPPQ